MTQQQAVAKLEIAQQQIAEALALLTSSPVPGASRPAREVPPCYDACKRLWEAAMKVDPAGSLFNIHDYIGEGIQQGQEQMNADRMSQAMQDRLENDVRMLGKSAWGQEWLSHDENAAMIDRRYCYYFMGYWLVRKSHNPEDGYVRRTDNPGMLPV